MLGPFDPKRHRPLADLDTLRDALACIEADVRRVAGLEGAANAIEAAMVQLVAFERRRLRAFPNSVYQTHAHARRRN